MNEPSSWTRHETRWRRRPALTTYHGHGSFRENTDEPDTDFKLDERSGLFLPETAAKERRKVKIGFHTDEADEPRLSGG